MTQEPTRLDGPPLPEMCDGTLDSAQLEDLVDDLAHCTQILSVQVKAAAQRQVGDGGVTLEVARGLLVDGHVRGVQIHYRFDGSEWCDTIMNLGGRYRLVRCRYSG